MEKVTKNLKILITFVLILIIIIAIICFCFNKITGKTYVNNDNQEENIIQSEDNNENSEEQEGIKKVSDNNEYYTVIKGIDKFSKCIRKEKEQEIIDLLDKGYINENEIKEENISEYIKYMGKYQKFYMYGLYKEKESDNTTKFYTYGKLAVGYDKEINIDIWYIVRVNQELLSYSIVPLYDEKRDIEEIKKNITNYTDEIDINVNNSVEYGQASDEFMSKEYFYNFQYRIIYDYNNFYNMIDSEYREKRFTDKNDYIEYLKSNYDNIRNMTIQKYQVEPQINYMEYICLNNRNTYYTIKVKNVMDYTILLDDYTIKTDKFKEVYNNSSDEEKVYTDIEIFLKMINNKDYKAAYGCLDDSFKNNNFESFDKFEKYVKEKFFDYTIIENIEKFEKVSSYYVCKTAVASGINLASDKGQKSFIVELKDDNKFGLSFEVE